MNKFQRDDDGNLIMNEHNIILICQQDGLYEYADLNSKLYLHFKAFRKIGGLDNFTNVKVLWLENNFISKIEGLDQLYNLTHLFLQNNLIEKMEGMQNNLQLHTINVTSNRLRKIENIQHLQNLSTLEIASNKLKNADDIIELQFNQSICTLNLQNNLLVFPQNDTDIIDPILSIFTKMSCLKCLYLQDNEYIRAVSNYRKTFLSNLHQLTYLDTQPVFPNERRLVEAWGREGKEGENKEREQIRSEEQEKKTQQRIEIRKQLPQHLQNKINLFTRNIEQLTKEITDLEQLRSTYLVQPNQEIQISYLNDTITTKQDSIVELNELLQNMKKRQLQQLKQSQSMNESILQPIISQQQKQEQQEQQDQEQQQQQQQLDKDKQQESKNYSEPEKVFVNKSELTQSCDKEQQQEVQMYKEYQIQVQGQEEQQQIKNKNAQQTLIESEQILIEQVQQECQSKIDQDQDSTQDFVSQAFSKITTINLDELD